MTEKDAAATSQEADRKRQLGKLLPLLVGGEPIGVIVGELREVVVARMRVPAAAILLPHGKGVVVIPRDSLDLELIQDWVDLPGMRAEATQIPEAEEHCGTSSPRVLRRRAEREMIAVGATEEGDRPFQTGIVHAADGITESAARNVVWGPLCYAPMPLEMHSHIERTRS